MYTNPSNIIKTLVGLLEQNAPLINKVVRVYEGSRSLNVFEGMRMTLGANAYPAFEIEPQNGANEWATTRAQRPRYTFRCTLTVKNSNERFGVEYICTLATAISEIMNSPENLQLRIVDETKWDFFGGLHETYMLNSFVDDITYSAQKEGTLRAAEFNWFVVVHEPFPDGKFAGGDQGVPVVLRPSVIKLR